MHPEGYIYTYIAIPFTATSFLPSFMLQRWNDDIESYDAIIAYNAYFCHIFTAPCVQLSYQTNI